MQNVLTIGIIGFGFSGLASLDAIVKNATHSLKVIYCDDSPYFGKGVAFATTDPKHLLNVRACQMGATSENVNDFYEWLCSHGSFWRSADPSFQDLEIFPESFLPRKLYGIYLEHFFNCLQVTAKKKDIDLVRINKNAIDAFYNSSYGIDVILEGNEHIFVNKLILATGVPTSKKFPFENAKLLNNKRYIPDIWKNKIYDQVLCPSNESCIGIIIGSGLTMIDAVTTLHAKGYKGCIIAISTKGLLPEHHLQVQTPPVSLRHLEKLPKKLLLLFKAVRKEIQGAMVSNCDFRPYIDTFRPLETSLWKQFSYLEKRIFLKYVFSIWNRYRHRMSPESFLLLKKLQDHKKFSVLKGKIENVEASQDKLIVYYSSDGHRSLKTINADFVIKCSGPQYDITKTDSSFIHNLHSNGLIEFDELDLGLAITKEGAIQGKAKDKIYAIGALLFGELFETTAVPEIREQAFAIAKQVLN